MQKTCQIIRHNYVTLHNGTNINHKSTIQVMNRKNTDRLGTRKHNTHGKRYDNKFRHNVAASKALGQTGLPFLRNLRETYENVLE